MSPNRKPGQPFQTIFGHQNFKKSVRLEQIINHVSSVSEPLNTKEVASPERTVIIIL